MGLKISTFKKGGLTFTDAYAKISDVMYDNDSKIASFGINIFISKDDKNLITKIPNQWTMIIPGIDIVNQCYAKINTHIIQVKALIAKLETETNAIVDNDNLVLRNDNFINQLKKDELLQLENSEEF